MSGRNEIHAENIVNSTIHQGSEEDPGFLCVKLSPKGIVTGSLIAPLQQLTVDQWASLHISLQLASEAALMMEPSQVIWPLGDALDLLGFTVVRPDDTQPETPDESQGDQ